MAAITLVQPLYTGETPTIPSTPRRPTRVRNPIGARANDPMVGQIVGGTITIGGGTPIKKNNPIEGGAGVSPAAVDLTDHHVRSGGTRGAREEEQCGKECEQQGSWHVE